MHQEQALNMNLSQHLAMTMKLQQAIQILQLSAQDLKTEIEKEYLENPALEMEYGDGADTRQMENLRAENISALAEYLEGDGNTSNGGFSDASSREHVFESATPVSTTLERELLEQAEFAFQAEEDLAVATFIIGSIDDWGYLTLPLKEIAATMQVTADKAERVLSVIQTFEPLGVGARDLAECLRIQAKALGIYEGLVAAVIDKHLSAVADARIKEIAAAENCKPADVQVAVDIVRKLDPKPGSAYGGAAASYITPDVVVTKTANGYQVNLNDTYIPQLKISSIYKNAEEYDKDTQKYINKRLSAASWLINSIEQRRSTIKKVVEEIVRVQQDFLEQGMKKLHPLTMQEVADAIGVHESTVSRAVANKYVELPGGIVALRKFFTANLAKSGDGEDFIAGQAKAVIKELIEGENPQKPLSDQKLCELLKTRKMDISRRTVMKYREALGYPSSVKRKRY